MKSKGKPESKIPFSQKKSNKKKIDDARNNTKLNKAFYKKNEFALILLGALLLTIIIFFVFFRSSGTDANPVAGNVSGTSFVALEKRIAALENSLNKPEDTKSVDVVVDKKSLGSDPLEQRIIRLETTVLVKFESLVERMDGFEKKIETLKSKTTVSTPVAVKPKPKATVPPIKKNSKKTNEKDKTNVDVSYCTKKETLYSISKKYKTTVSALKKLNNLSEKDKIFPGDNIIIK